jgi:hypothetical protein
MSIIHAQNIKGTTICNNPKDIIVFGFIQLAVFVIAYTGAITTQQIRQVMDMYIVVDITNLLFLKKSDGLNIKINKTIKHNKLVCLVK